MARPIQEPTVEQAKGPGDSDVEIVRHPSFGMASVHHVSGVANLYGSDFEHHHYVVLEISKSYMQRDLSRDWHFGKEQVVQIALSEAQFVSLVANPNTTGVPCTIEYIGGQMIPGLPRRDSTRLYSKDVEAKMEKAAAALRKHRDEIAAAVGKLPKKTQAEVLGPLDAAIRELDQNAPFVMRSFGEHIEDTIEKAKVEVEAYVRNTIHRAGLAVLQGDPQPLALPKFKPESEVG